MNNKINEYKKKLRDIFTNNGYVVHESEDDLQLELDSLQFIAIICDIEEKFNVDLPEEMLTGKNLNDFNDFYISLVNIQSK